MSSGFVYILDSKNSDCIKIGGTDFPPIKRIREINSTEPYKKLGEWHLADFRQVLDWRKVESNLHYRFRSKLNTQQSKQKELFYLSIKEASDALNDIDEQMIIAKPKVDRMFCDNNFKDYLSHIFQLSGLLQFLDYQGAWVFVLFPSTEGGRYFTLNIGSHEVAFSTLNKKNISSTHMIILDSLILEFPQVLKWVRKHRGFIEKSHYKTALNRAVTVYFEGEFKIATEFLSLDGVRRALIAYWYDALFKLKDNRSLSVYARFHNYNAISRLVRDI